MKDEARCATVSHPVALAQYQDGRSTAMRIKVARDDTGTLSKRASPRPNSSPTWKWSADASPRTQTPCLEDHGRQLAGARRARPCRADNVQPGRSPHSSAPGGLRGGEEAGEACEAH